MVDRVVPAWNRDETKLLLLMDGVVSDVWRPFFVRRFVVSDKDSFATGESWWLWTVYRMFVVVLDILCWIDCVWTLGCVWAGPWFLDDFWFFVCGGNLSASGIRPNRWSGFIFDLHWPRLMVHPAIDTLLFVFYSLAASFLFHFWYTKLHYNNHNHNHTTLTVHWTTGELVGWLDWR